jgi:hypothetical protein
MTLFEVAREISARLQGIFLRGPDGKRPVYGGSKKFQEDEHWKDLVLFYEYFHGDNGAGLGASHQTGWTGIVARLIQLSSILTPEVALHGGTRPTMQLYHHRQGWIDPEDEERPTERPSRTPEIHAH